jgi:site-specific recombinase XerD
MPALKISKKTVGLAAIPPVRDAYYWDTELKGFGLRVTPKGARSYVVQYRMKGGPAQRMTLGGHGAPWTPETAREQAQAILIEVKKGANPIEIAKRKQRDARTLAFEDYLDRFAEECLKEEWPDSWEEAKRTLQRHALPHLKGKALPAITEDDIAAVIDPLRPRKPLARKVWAVLSRLFTFAIEDRKLKKAANPMDGVRAPPKPDNRKRTLSPDETVAAWQASQQLNPPFGAFVRLLFCTLQRRTEVAGVPWKELDQARAVWKVDATRAKNDEDFLAPLNDLAMRELDSLGWKRRGFALTTTGSSPISGFSKAKKALDAAMLPILQKMADDRADALGEPRHPVKLERWTFHDIRRTGTTVMQSLGIPVEVTERCIAHKSGRSQTGVAQIYNLWAYEPEKRAAFDKWGEYLERLIAGADASNVIALAERRA